ncbi:hypothetical protein PYW08_012980 [Mythimna loreyi]|uniref:Uncharacterized protein n=1 Tax=Mythimna loreyi TaxID=667449 RepID=A0ACC2PZ07_9NEOP|nr:hypothetical protein PYW08_012980 [Mythimna loreyi]
MDVNTMDNSTLISFNCKSFKRSFECVKMLSCDVDVIGLQETWLQPSEIPFLGEVNKDFSFFGKSALDTGVMLQVRPYGGVALLWRNTTFDSVTVIPCSSDRVVAIKVHMSNRSSLIVNVYMPTDTPDNLLEFVDCLSEIAAIVESSDTENVYILGDFNAHPGELFGKEMLNFCSEQNWICADLVKLGTDSYTFISDVHGSRRWLDHCLVSEAAWKTVTSVKVHCDIYWSDHFPLEVQCNMMKAIPKSTASQGFQLNKVSWGERNLRQIELYTEECNSKLKQIDFPSKLRHCCDNMCNNQEHKLVIDDLYNNIIVSLREAAESSYEGHCKGYSGKGRPILGWNKYVRDAHRSARQKFANWVWHGKPYTYRIYLR